MDLKEYKPSKDFRTIKDFYHYTNELTSVVYGENLITAYYRLLMLDHFIIYLLLNDFNQYGKIIKKKYGLKKLYEIKENYEFSYATLKYAKLVEDNEYICYVLKNQNKYKLNNICNIAIDREIESRRNRFQIILTIIGLILALVPIIEFIQKFFILINFY